MYETDLVYLTKYKLFVDPDGNILTRYGRPAKGTITSYGYRKVTNQFAHRLVAMALIPNPDNKPFVNHIDANKLNNHPSNLEWCTNLENVRHHYNLVRLQKGMAEKV